MQMIQKLAHTCLLITALLQTRPAHSQDNKASTAQKMSVKNSALPKILLLPWQSPGVDPDSLRLTKKARDLVTQKLKETFAPNAQPLNQVIDKQKIPLALTDDLQQVFAHEESSQETSLAFIPIWTHFHDHEFLALLVIDAHSNSVRNLAHKLIPRDQLMTAYKNKSVESIFTPEFLSFVASVKSDTKQTTTDDLALFFREQASAKRPNEIDRMTLNLLLGYKLATQADPKPFVLINPFATELLATIHRIHGLSKNMRKPNRIIFTQITYEDRAQMLKLPVKLSTGFTMTEGVFGKTITPSWREQLTVTPNRNGQVNLDFSDKINKAIENELQSLRRSELPQIAKIRGAWAYVDKGRAWGLQMNDRLVIADGSGLIKGHVVGYFGPEMKLKSPRGYAIHEGAIIFIRKGQKNLKEGLSLSYDQQKVPSF